jgi:uncharacterized damage-inducible protein DinB
MERSFIEAYAQGADVPAGALAGLSAADLDAYPVPGTWSIRQILVHLMDSDLIGAFRMKRVIALDNPTLLNYDESAFANRLAYATTDVEPTCQVFRLNRLLMAEILRGLPEEAFARVGQHSEQGPLSLRQLVDTYIEHLDHHMKFLRQKRAMLGKPLA